MLANSNSSTCLGIRRGVMTMRMIRRGTRRRRRRTKSNRMLKGRSSNLGPSRAGCPRRRGVTTARGDRILPPKARGVCKPNQCGAQQCSTHHSSSKKYRHMKLVLPLSDSKPRSLRATSCLTKELLEVVTMGVAHMETNMVAMRLLRCRPPPQLVKTFCSLNREQITLRNLLGERALLSPST